MFVKIARYVRREIRPGGRISCQSGDGVLFQLTHKLANPVHPRFTLFQVLHEFQARRPVQPEVLGLLLQQADQPHRIDVVFLVKFNHAAFFVAFQFADPQFLRLLTQTGNIQQVAGGIGQAAKTIDQLDFDLLQIEFVFGAGNALIE